MKARLSMIMLDIDHFKNVNDTYGHKAGDDVIRFISKTIKNSIRKVDFAARYGGEEFVILSNGNKESKKVLEKLCKQIENEEFRFEEQILRITVTIGVADYDSGRSNDLWISAADEKLYYGKRDGKNKVVV